MKCFKCQKETAKPGEVYYRFKKLGEDNFNTYCCQSCWDNHRDQILKDDKTIIQVSGEQDNLHQIVYTQPKCSSCNKYKKAQCQCSKESSEKDYLPIWFHKEIESLWYLLTYNPSLKNQKSLEESVYGEKEQIINTITKLKKELSLKNKNSQAYQKGDKEIREIEKELNKRGINLSYPKLNNSDNLPNSNNIPEGAVPSDNSINPSPTQIQSNKSEFNLKNPLVIGGISILGLGIIGLVIYLFTRNKSKSESS